MENRSVDSEVHRYKLGDIAVTVLSDGSRTVPPDNYIANAPKEELIATLASAGLPTDHMRNTYAPIVLETSGKRVLIDTGNGEAMFAQSKGERGRRAGERSERPARPHSDARAPDTRPEPGSSARACSRTSLPPASTATRSTSW
jgi:hypothetical protein